MTHDAIVVGSGFGGSIAALRMAERGKRVLVLERGRRWAPSEFPRDARDTDRVFWHPEAPDRSRGLYDLRMLSGLGVVTAAGVGGGSLVYANIHVRPDADAFTGWPAPYSRKMLDPYFDRVARNLSIAPVPIQHALKKRKWFRTVSKRLGMSAFDPDQAVAWDDPRVPGRSACQLCASCEFGCTFGAKNTLDFTYLRQAERLGATIATGIDVTHVAPAPAGGYSVLGEDLERSVPIEFSAPRVVLCAGTLGTGQILLASRDVHGTLPALSPRLGTGFSANGDFLGTLQASADPIDGMHGPDCTSVLRAVDGGQKFTLAAPAFNRAAAEILSRFGVTRELPKDIEWHGLADAIRAAFKLGFFSQPLPIPLPGSGKPENMTNLFAIGRDNANGRMHLASGKLDIEWNYADENAALVGAMDALMEKIAQTSGGRYAPLPTWNIFRRPMTVHPLGGCRLSLHPDDGVVSTRGEVHGYPGLFVADGSLIPAALGFHPAMTIAAVCEYVASELQRA